VQAAIHKIQDIEEEAGSKLTIIMIAHRLQTIETAKNLLFIENSKTIRAAEKGTPEYDQIIQKLKTENYKHQEMADLFSPRGTDMEDSEVEMEADVAPGADGRTGAPQLPANRYSIDSKSPIVDQSPASHRPLLRGEVDEQKAQMSDALHERKTADAVNKSNSQSSWAGDGKQEVNDMIDLEEEEPVPNAGFLRVMSHYRPKSYAILSMIASILSSATMPLYGFVFS